MNHPDTNSNADPAPRLAELYNKQAKAYEQANSTMHPNLLRLADLFVSHLPAGAHILDVGCGTGRDMAHFESRGFHCTGVDLSSGLLERAQANVQGELYEMDMRRIGDIKDVLTDGLLDGAWIMASLLHLPLADTPAFLTNLRNLLSHGAPVIISTKAGDGERWEESTTAGMDARFFARWQPDELSDALKHASFKVQQVKIVEARGEQWIELLATAN